MGRVIAIADGDTLTILTTEQGQHRVRLAGIDTPEKRQPFGQIAKDHFSSLVMAKRSRSTTSSEITTAAL